MYPLKRFIEIIALILLSSNVADLFDLHITTNVEVSGNGAQIINPVTNDVQEWQNLPDQPLPLPPPPPPSAPPISIHPSESFKQTQPSTANIQLESWSPLPLLSALFPRQFAWYHNVYIPNVVRPAPPPPPPAPSSSSSSPTESQYSKYVPSLRSSEKSYNSINNPSIANSEPKINSGFIYKNGRTYIHRWNVILR